MRKLLLTVLTCLCAVCALFGLSACYDLETIEIDGYSLYAEAGEDGTYTIVGVPDGTFEQTTWEIPAQLGEYKISRVGMHRATGLMMSEEVFYSFGRVRRLIVPKGIKEIRAERLENIVIYETEASPSEIDLYQISGDNAWWYSPQEALDGGENTYKYLTEENFVGDLVYITETAEMATETGAGSGMETATLLYALGEGALTIPQEYNGLPVTKIADCAFENSLYTSVTIGGHITSIGKNAFQKSDLQEISLPENCKNITEGMFANTKLTSIDFPQNLEMIGDSAFLGTKLSSVNIPQNVISIGARAFENCELLSLKLPSSVVALGSYAFQNNPLENIDLSESELSYVPTGGFRDCPLTGCILLPQKLTRIGIYGFANAKFASFDFPISLNLIERRAFENVQLESIILPNSLERIEEFAFGGNLALTELILPDSCQDFHEEAISGCKNLKKIYLGKVKALTYLTDTCPDLTDISVSPENEMLYMENGILYYKNDSAHMLVKCPKTVQIEHLTLENCLLARDAVRDCQSLKTVEISCDLSFTEYAIPRRAFFGCTSLQKVILPSNCLRICIESGAFNGCVNLSEIDLSKVWEIGYGSFQGCLSLETADFTSATLIATEAFQGCNLKEVHTYHVNGIGNRAFANNVNLEKVILENCSRVGNEAFAGCKRLRSCDTGNAEIYAEAFRDTPLEMVRGCRRGCNSLGNYPIYIFPWVIGE